MSRANGMKCLETRSREGMRWRRYRTAAGGIWTTFEVPVTVIGELGRDALRDALARAERKLQRIDRNARALRMLAEGVKPSAVANEIGLSDSQARRIRQRGKRQAPKIPQV